MFDNVKSQAIINRYIFLAVQAYDKGEVSEGELCDLLRCDRVTAREVVDRHLTTTDVSDEGEVRQIQLESRYSLLGDVE